MQRLSLECSWASFAGTWEREQVARTDLMMIPLSWAGLARAFTGAATIRIRSDSVSGR